MKIAAITDDGTTISQHFGRAPYYAVLTINSDQTVNRELREKPSHRQFAQQNCRLNGVPRGFGPGSRARHAAMASAISDCDMLLCRGMGWGAYQSVKEHGLRTVVTDIANIEEAVQAYLDGKMIDRPRGCRESDQDRMKGREVS